MQFLLHMATLANGRASPVTFGEKIIVDLGLFFFRQRMLHTYRVNVLVSSSMKKFRGRNRFVIPLSQGRSLSSGCV